VKALPPRTTSQDDRFGSPAYRCTELIELRLPSGEQALGMRLQLGSSLLQLAAGRGEPHADVLVAQSGVEQFVGTPMVCEIVPLGLRHAIDKVVDALLTTSNGIGHT
jgi:hypothetical protein